MLQRALGWWLVVLIAGCASVPREQAGVGGPLGVIGVEPTHLTADYWARRAPRANAVVLDPIAIAHQNERLKQTDRSVRDLEQLPTSLAAAEVRAWIEALSSRPTRTLYDEQGREVTARQVDEWMATLNLDGVAATQATRYGMVVRRADVRTFPTRARVFSNTDDTDIDRFQESALFPGTPVAIAHTSRDGEWLFVVSALYSAWIEKGAVAEGGRDRIFAYAHKSPYVVVTGAKAHTVYTPERPELSSLQLEMGARVPLLPDWPIEMPVNGQHPYTAHVVELPYRAADGSLQFAPALLPKTQEVDSDYLPLTRANVLRQGFKFLGERYGWGHSYDARDCSGFVSEVYRSFGVQLPRNTHDQGVSPALNRIELTDADDHAARVKLLGEAQVGDLIYIPGHVMMVIGHEKGEPYVIHDTTGISFRRDGGDIERARLNGVSVTPLLPLLLSDGRPMIDRVYSIQRIR
ncbi:SH3 domain-containing protein [Steroidobacter flavus]|uniref:SH3 domain-containing protein n=1 Tax=Steroidobacter flavus TaxID=1842136 RepID=A0ABV8T0Z2_9GAMM